MQYLLSSSSADKESQLAGLGNGERFSASTSGRSVWVGKDKSFPLETILKIQLHAFEIDHAFGIHENLKIIVLNCCIAIFLWRELQVVR